jgi:hypothetical protein
MSIVHLVHGDEDHRFGLLSDFHIFVDLEEILGIGDLGEIIEISMKRRFGLIDPIIDGNEIFRIHSEFPEVEHIGENLGDIHEILSGHGTNFPLDESEGIRLNDGGIDEAIINEICLDL